MRDRFIRKIGVSGLAVICLTACSDLVVRPPSADSHLEDFQAVWNTVDQFYPCLEFKAIDWDSVYTAFRPRAEAARGDEFYQVLHDLLGVLRDGHVRYMTPGGTPASIQGCLRTLGAAGLPSAFLWISYEHNYISGEGEAVWET